MTEFAGWFWFWCALLVLLAAFFVAAPLRRARRAAADAGESGWTRANIALFREREQELEAEFAAGVLDREECDALLLELRKSLLLEADSAEQPHRAAARESVSRRSPALLAPLALALLLPPAAWLMYQQWGQFEAVELMDQFQRTARNDNDPEVARELALSLGQVVQEHPERPWAWYFLGENFSVLGMFDVANSAYRQAAARLTADDEKALALGRAALTAYIVEQLRITPEVRELIDQTLALDPDEPNALQLLATDAREREDYAAAIGYWRRLSQLNPDSQLARENIADLRRLRAGEDVGGGPVVEVAVAVAAGLALDPRARVFVSARNAAADGMPPLAVAELAAAELPARIRLDDSLAVGPFNLSSAESAYVSVLVSRSGSANRASGDYIAESAAFSLASPPQPVQLVISEIVP